jgi:hypothetical protein
MAFRTVGAAAVIIAVAAFAFTYAAVSTICNDSWPDWA